MSDVTTLVANTLVKKLAEVMAVAQRIPKRGRNDFHKYDYATEADIAEAIRAELAARHVMLIPEVRSYEVRELVSKKPDKDSRYVTYLSMRFSFHDGDSGELIERDWLGAGEDSGDKGVYKAMTGAEKYFLLKTFLMPTGDDPEHEGKNTQHERDKATIKPSAAEKKARVKAPDGTVYIDKIVPRSKGNSEWAEIITSSGEEYIANVPQLISLAFNIAQENVPVVLTTHVNSKGKTQLDAINRWKPNGDAPTPAAVPAEEPVM